MSGSFGPGAGSTTAGLGARARHDAIREIQNRVPRKFDPPRDDKGRRLRISEFYGMNTFDVHSMREKLPKEVFNRLMQTVESGRKLDAETAHTIAHAVKEWALERGVTHFTHWFQPQTGSTAEKHDAFLAFDDTGRPIEKFTGAMLIQSEPDASSFPSGGMRTTFEARGYTAWDPSSPIFIMDGASTKTLCIPSVFISYHGDALDEKTGLLKSMEALSARATELLGLVGMTQVKRVIPTLGIEQEYFLIDRSFASLRPDLLMSGRTLLGGQPPKGQQLEDHYFGSIPARVQAFMSEMEYELYKLGVPVKTRHNEVAPSQFETAPIFEEANVATDHNQLVMEILKKVALRHHFTVLLHEKPFAGVNGSGKHNNWSMSITGTGTELDGENLLDPGKTPHDNLRFLLMLAAVLKGVHRHAGLLRASIASSGNDHRLGANEAPPAIISVFLGDLLTKICQEIEKGSPRGQSPEAAVIQLGVDKLPTVMKDNTDRNRTSPFAFTGNKFEFRAVGSSASSAFPVTIINSAVADGMESLSVSIRSKLKQAVSLESAIWETIQETIRETKNVRFEGNGYSEDWVKEAEKRGLPNLRKTPEALAQIVAPQSLEMLTRLGIFSEPEVHSRFHVRVERFVKNLAIEVDTLKQLTDTLILPACYGYHAALAGAVATAKAAGVTAPQLPALQRMGTLVQELLQKREVLDRVSLKAEQLSSEEEKAVALSRDVSVAMAELRKVCDDLEAVVADDFWPLPKYREMLFIS